MKSTAAHIDAPEAAQRLGISRATLYAYVSRGLVRAVADTDDPRRSLYNAADIAALADRKTRSRKPESVANATLDFGLPVLASGITSIADGRLAYRGRDATDVAATASLEDAARLLWDCGADDPFADPAPEIDPVWPELAGGLARLSVFERSAALLPLVRDATQITWQRETRRLWPSGAALVRAIAAAATGRLPSSEPVHRQLGAAWGIDAAGADTLRTALVLLADHELNASTFAVRVVASTGASLASALSAGLGALSGPLHGGQTSLVEALFEEAERAGDAAALIDRRLWRGDRLPGFDHPLYPEGDPRASALLARLPADPLRADLIAAMDRLGKRPNVDFATVSMRRSLGLPQGSALAVFAVGRSVGWIAHALEQRATGKLIRPRARYDGRPE
ncbi:MAG: citrate synthase [Phreatobacter sp.]|uniref:citrate/2-methylcitrate synthase n=1 Tax=Phreatobacter sp. TaxID=1966341 RepID=UPI001A5539CA|nr:citrate/2-methylcitrate synthase [Phreatobacter sp.]MBL8571097.1 citrate synthase [Phreatobacter sp.]